MMPMHINMPAVERPWFTMYKIPPSMPTTLKANMASSARPMCAMELYATKRFTSFCTQHTKLMPRMPMSASAAKKGASASAPSGAMGNANRSAPY